MRLVDADRVGYSIVSYLGAFAHALLKNIIMGWRRTFNSQLAVGVVRQSKENDWIPCSDGKNLPNDTHNVKWDYTTSGSSDKGCSVLVTIKGGFVKETIFWKYMNDFDDDDVIAWKALPEPYKH